MSKPDDPRDDEWPSIGSPAGHCLKGGDDPAETDPMLAELRRLEEYIMETFVGKDVTVDP